MTDFATVPLMEPISPNGMEPVTATPPKRGRHPANCTCPKHAGGIAKPTRIQPKERAPKRTRTVTTPRASLETRIGAFLAQINLGMAIACAMVPGLRADDPLTAAEITVLAKSINAEAQSHAKFRKYLETFLAVSTAGQLWIVVTMIGMRRMARRDIILHAGMDEMIGMALSDPDAFGEMLAATMAQNVTPPDTNDAATDAAA